MLRIQKFSIIKTSKQPNVNISTNYPLLKGTDKSLYTSCN